MVWTLRGMKLLGVRDDARGQRDRSSAAPLRDASDGREDSRGFLSSYQRRGSKLLTHLHTTIGLRHRKPKMNDQETTDSDIETSIRESVTNPDTLTDARANADADQPAGAELSTSVKTWGNVSL